MAGLPTDNTGLEKPAAERSYWQLELAVPLLSFGGALLAIVFWISNAQVDIRIPITGCVLASWALAYLAWIRPKKDIVALTTPLYSLILISVPTDIFSAVFLQVLYAVSLTLLLVRLKYRFGAAGTAASRGKELGGSLKAYIEQTRDAFRDTRPEAAHSAALAFVRFAEGNYREAAESSHAALSAPENSPPGTPLMRAFGIIREHSSLLHKSLPRPVEYLAFPDSDRSLLANPVNPAGDEDTKFYSTLDNALLLAYSAAWTVSERDRPHLLACQAFAQKLFTQ